MVDEGLSYSEFTDVSYVQGGTLTRFLHDPELSQKYKPGYEWFWVFEPTAMMLEMQCDDCVKRHNPKNLDCSATRMVRSPAIKSTVLYPFHHLDERSRQIRRFRLDLVDYDSRIGGCIAKLVLDTP